MCSLCSFCVFGFLKRQRNRYRAQTHTIQLAEGTFYECPRTHPGTAAISLEELRDRRRHQARGGGQGQHRRMTPRPRDDRSVAIIEGRVPPNYYAVPAMPSQPKETPYATTVALTH